MKNVCILLVLITSSQCTAQKKKFCRQVNFILLSFCGVAAKLKARILYSGSKIYNHLPFHIKTLSNNLNILNLN